MMKSVRSALAATAILVLAACTQVPLSTKTVNLVEGARQAVVSMKANKELRFFNDLLKDAVAVAVFPAVIKGGFFIGAEGGNGVVLAKQANGEWGYPAFYTLAAGSFGLQAGGQTAEVVLIIRNQKALNAIIRHQGKLGADIGAAVGSVGVGYEGATTTNLNFDIVAFSSAAGLFAGTSVEGSAMIRRNDYNQAYYGGTPTPNSILIENAVRNTGADGLRRALTVR